MKPLYPNPIKDKDGIEVWIDGILIGTTAGKLRHGPHADVIGRAWEEFEEQYKANWDTMKYETTLFCPWQNRNVHISFYVE